MGMEHEPQRRADKHSRKNAPAAAAHAAAMTSAASLTGWPKVRNCLPRAQRLAKRHLLHFVGPYKQGKRP